jgi:hypothetical protein
MSGISIQGAINHIRLIVDAIVSGKIEAKTVAGMTDDQLDQYVTRLQQEARAATDEGDQLDQNSGG